MKSLRVASEGFSDLSNIRSASVVGSGDLGTGKVVKPDINLLAAQWFRDVGVSGTKSDWEEYAKRSGAFPEDIEGGWNYLAPMFAASNKSNKPSSKHNSEDSEPVDDVRDRIKFGEALLVLKTVIGEGVSWSGYSVPNVSMINMPNTGNPGFGFHTKSAEQVWASAKQVADADPKLKTDDIISKALEQSDSALTELTPEDIRMLEMAINWYLSGKISGMETPTPTYGGNKTAGARGDATTMGRAT